MYQKISYVLFFFAAFALPARGQGTFEKRIDLGESTNGYCIIQIKEGGYLIGGSISDSLSILNETPYIAKLDSEGNVEWVRTIGKQLGGQSKALAESADGSFFAVGTLYNSDTNWTFLTKFDALGNTIWTKLHSVTYYYTDFYGKYSILSCPDSGCVVAWTDNYDIGYVKRFAAEGWVKWGYNFPAINQRNNILTSIVSLDDSSYIITGYTTGRAGGFLTIMKMTESGDLLWYRQLSDTSNQDDAFLGNSTYKTGDGGFVIFGTNLFHGFSKGSKGDFYISKFDPNGFLAWDKNIDGFENENGTAVIELSNGNFIAVGTQSDSLQGTTDSTIFIIVTNTGEIKSTRVSSGSNLFSEVFAIAPTTDGGYLLIGNIGDSKQKHGILLKKLDKEGNGCNLNNTLVSSRSLGTALTADFYGKYDAFSDYSSIINSGKLSFAETDICTISAISPSISKKENISLYPNPLSSKEQFTISLEDITAGSYNLTLRDLLGKEIKYEKINLTGEKQNIIFDMHECAAGVYFIELQNEKGVVAKAKVVKE